MNQKNKLQQISINFFNLLIVSAVLPWISLPTAADQYKDCAPIDPKCGFKLKIAYPFWDSRQQDYCGHPAFKLDCVEDSYLTITIEKETYKIININYQTNSFTISKPQFFDDACPDSVSQLANSTLNDKVFKFSTDTRDAMLFYHCNNQRFADSPPYGFSCKKMDGYTGKPATANSELGYLAIEKKWESQLRENCGVQVFVPILKNSATELVSGASNIEKVLNKGFEVEWMKEEVGQCDDCQNSGGRCGYNRTLKGGVCFCKNGGVYDGVCGGSTHLAPGSSLHVEPTSQVNADKQKPNQNLIMLGAGIAVSVLLSMTLCLYFYRRHRNKESSMKFQTHNKSFGALSSKSSMQFLTGSTYFGVQVFNYRELEEATEFFNPVRELGEGGFGTVYYGKLRDGREVAIKRLYENNSKRAEQFLNEVEILANLRHKNLVNLHGCTSRQSRELLLVYEYVPNGTVADHLHGKQSKLGLLKWSTRLSIATETASALVYLHDSDIIHRDVKTQNILLDTDFTVKVADFGLSRLFPLDVTHVSTAPQGTPGYVDPEYHQCYQLTEKSDVYSFGVLLAELISSLPAVDITRKKNEINLSNLAMNKIQDHAVHELVDSSLGFESDYKLKKEITAVAELCFQCLQSTKEMRPNMSEVFKRLLSIQGLGKTEMDSAEVLDIPADDVLMLKGDFSPSSPPMEDTLANQYKLNASV